eukprot:scaffold19168_cov107-Isochrysis_galbana.AAC.6
MRRPEVPEGILWRQAPTTNKKGADQAAQSTGSHFFHFPLATGSAEPALFKPTEFAPTRDPINHPYTVGCALSTALKQALSQPEPEQPSSSRTASDSVSEAVPSHCDSLSSPGYTPTPTFRDRSTRTSEKTQMTLAPLEAFETNYKFLQRTQRSLLPTRTAQRTANLPNSNPSGVRVGTRPGAGDRGPALTSSDLPSLW